MELLDRELQKQLLQAMAERYPAECSPAQLGMNALDRKWAVNAAYMAEHKLIKTQSRGALGVVPQIWSATITARGLDFLQDDGGLGAMLGVVTVRFDADTLKAFISDHIDSSPMPDKEKSRVKTWLQSAGTEALKETTRRLVGAAIEHAPEALRLLQSMPG